MGAWLRAAAVRWPGCGRHRTSRLAGPGHRAGWPGPGPAVGQPRTQPTTRRVYNNRASGSGARRRQRHDRPCSQQVRPAVGRLAPTATGGGSDRAAAAGPAEPDAGLADRMDRAAAHTPRAELLVGRMALGRAADHRDARYLLSGRTPPATAGAGMDVGTDGHPVAGLARR